jgi:NADH:ubiquinone oxidoreductase subunit 4 (subunit M)
MNLIFLVFCWGDSYGIVGGIMFCFMHAILSTLMFFLVDCVQKRFYSRSVVELSGLLHLTPNLGISILVMCIFYSGVPGTLKFSSEFYIFSGLLESSPITCCLLMLFANVLGLIGFSKCWFNVVFGTMNNALESVPMDLTTKEILIISNCYLLLVVTIFFTNFYF